MLVQASSPLHHCSSGPTNSLPPGVLQPETYPPSERPVKHLSRRPRQYTFWNCLHLRWYWGPDNCCKPAYAPSPRARRLREVMQLTSTSLSLEPPTPLLDTDTAGHPNHTPSAVVPETIARFVNAPYPWTTSHVAPLGHTSININRPNFPLSLPATLPLYLYEVCHRLSSLPHMRLRLQPAVLSNVSQLLPQTDAADPPSLPWEILRGSFRSRTTYSRRLPTTPNAPSPTVSAVINTARKISDSDSRDSSLATPINSTQLSDVPHQDGEDCDTRKSPTNSPHLPITPPTTRHTKPSLRSGKIGTLLCRRLFLTPQPPQALCTHTAYPGHWTETRRLNGTTSSTTASASTSATPVPAPATPTEAHRAQCLMVYLWVNWLQEVSITTTRYPSRYLPQSPSHPTCRPQTPTQPDTEPVSTHWIPHRCSQKL